MATVEEFTDSLTSFAESCNQNERLMSMIKDWNRVLQIHADDLEEDITLTTENGRVSAVPGAPDAPNMVIRAVSDTLTEVFYGEISPNEPYNEGTLRIQGPEDDIVRLDFVIAMLWE